ncbi:hypothetical protein DL771_001268 [Monosporascus sp. 5C6A]|nr:hypothetical protein DL771_001268 [Monosporascus sp. 5C6A]
MVTIEQFRVQRRDQQPCDGVIVAFAGQDEGFAPAVVPPRDGRELPPPGPLQRSPSPGAPSARTRIRSASGCTEHALTSARSLTGPPPQTSSRLSSARRTRSPPSRVRPCPAPVHEHQPRGSPSCASATAAAAP